MASTLLKGDIEIKLDDCIVKALDSLLRNYQASDDFYSIFQEKMFLKSNTKAFIHVSHYLFTILDEKEFKKRFYWPIKCKADENHFRTTTVDYINFLIEQGKLKMDKIKAMHVVIPYGIKFMKFLLKVIMMVLHETVNRKKATNIEVKTPLGDLFILLLKKGELLTEIGVELRKNIVADIHEIKEKTESIEKFIGKIFFDGEVTTENRREFFEKWMITNNDKFKKIQDEQNNARKCIATFERICNQGQKSLKPQKFIEEKFNSDVVKQAISIVKDKTGFVHELNSYEFFDSVEVIKLIKYSIEHVVALMSRYSLRDLDEIKEEAAVVKDLYAKTMSITAELKVLLNHFGKTNSSPLKIENSSQNRDSQLVLDVFSTPPVAINTKESENLSMINLPFARYGNRDATKLNYSQQGTIQVSKRELQFSPQINRSILMPLIKKDSMKQPLLKKRQFTFNSSSIFSIKERQKTMDNLGSISRLDSYSLVMQVPANVFSSTVLDQSGRNLQTPMNTSILMANKKFGTNLEAGLNTKTNIKENENLLSVSNRSQHLTPQKRVSINAILSPKILLNDNSLNSPSFYKSTSLSSLTNSTSPSNRITRAKTRPALNFESFSISSENNTLKDESPNTLDVLSKLNKLNLEHDKENLFDMSETLLINDSI